MHIGTIIYTTLILCFHDSTLLMQGIVRLLRQSDAQLFSGWGPHGCINDSDVLAKLDKCAEKAATLLRVSS